MAIQTKSIEDVWNEKGNLPTNAIVATADGKYPPLDGSLITGIGAGGDVSPDIDAFLQSADNAEARTSLELGSTDTVEFGAFIPPTGTTAEIDALFSGSLAVPDAIYFDREKQQQWQALTTSTRQIVSGVITGGISYYIDSENGDDLSGKLNDARLPFATITAAFNSWETYAPEGVVDFHIASGVYDESNVMAGVSSHSGSTVRVHCTRGVTFLNTSGVVFDNSSAITKFAGVFGYPRTSLAFNAAVYSGACIVSASGTTTFQLGTFYTVGGDILQLTGGRAVIDIEQLTFKANGINGFTCANTESSIRVGYLHYSGFAASPNFLVALSGTSHCTLSDVASKNVGWANMLDATSKVVIRSCAHDRLVQGNPVDAAVATTNVFFLGDSGSVGAVGVNVTPNTTFGSFTTNALAANLVEPI